MADGPNDPERARRFGDAALPHLDEVYTLARYLMRNTADAEDAVQECYLRALKHFDTFRGGAIRPWLFAILRNVCRSAFAQRCSADAGAAEAENAVPVWSEPPETPETQVLRNRDQASIQALVNALPDMFREAIVLREVHDLSYREIAVIADVPVGTVMSRLARARSMLRAAWNAAEETPR
jgi:RNA polymerase sigma-70 factor (ECF subfamily)